MQENLENIRRLVGPVSVEQLLYVDCFATPTFGLFMPVGGACRDALAKEHTHPAYMFVLAFDDHTRITLDGHTLTTKPGQVFALAPDIPHTELPDDLPPRYLALMITSDFWHEQLLAYPDAGDIALSGNFFAPPAVLLPTCKKFMIEFQSKGAGSDGLLHALAIEICHYLIRTVCGIEQPGETASSRFEIDRVVEFIQANMDRRITSGDMAKVACMSPSHFSRVFRQEMGTSPYDYLLDSRLRRAKKLLQAGEKTVSDIALECGFSSASHFSAKFSARYNLPPARYRKSFG